jgi:hypothetical protein
MTPQAARDTLNKAAAVLKNKFGEMTLPVPHSSMVLGENGYEPAENHLTVVDVEEAITVLSQAAGLQ